MRGIIGKIHYGDRGAEWLCASAMCGWASSLVMPGNSLSLPSLLYFDEFQLGETFWFVAIMGIGLFRLASLYVNGRSPRTPVFRRVGAAMGFMAWTQVFLAIVALCVLKNRAMPPATGIYAVLITFELISFHRAMRDDRYRR